jgi:SnoaL-like domain
MQDRFEIRELIENWAVWRDAGDWDRFASVWHDDGWMMTTWFQAPAKDFIARSRAGFENGLKVLHLLGGSSIEVVGDRAVAHTKMEIIQRAEVHGIEADVRCQGRFVDALEKRNGRWGLVLRQPVYELDAMRAIDPSAKLVLDQARLAQYPEGYRHLAYLQVEQGMDVYRNMPGTRGEEIAKLNLRMADWLAGEPARCLREAA